MCPFILSNNVLYLQMFMIAAAGGNIDAWYALKSMIAEAAVAGSDSLITRKVLEISPLVYSQLQASRIPTEELSRPDQVMVLARHALDALFLGFRCEDPDVLAQLEQSTIQHWLDIWSWCRFFYFQVVERDMPGCVEPDGVEFKDEVCTTLAHLFMSLASHVNTCRTLKLTKGFPEMIGAMHLLRVVDHRFPHIIQDVTTTIVRMMDNDTHLKNEALDSHWVPPFIDVLNRKPFKTVNDFLERIENAVSGRRINCDALYIETMACIGCFGVSPVLTRCGLVRDAIPKLTLVMRRVASRRNLWPADQIEILCHCITAIAYFLGAQLPVGPRWIIQALKGRLILTIFKCTKFYQFQAERLPPNVPNLDFLLSRLLDIMTPYLVYPSILRLVEKAIRTHKSWDIKMPVQCKWLPPAWEAFGLRVEEERKLLTSSRTSGDAPFVLCHNTEVPILV